MSILKKLTKAIKWRKPISFEYNKPDKISGRRIGNTHAIYIYTAKSGEQSTKVHIVQTAGVSDTKTEKPFPSFRTFNIENLTNVTVLDDKPKFEISEEYNPEWQGYENVIEKV